MTALQAIFSKATTTVDGGWNVTFATHEAMSKQITEITALREEALYVVVMTEAEYYAQQIAKK
jgi:hypothetical protein